MKLNDKVVSINECKLQFKEVIDIYIEHQRQLQRSWQTCKSYYEGLKRFCKYLCEEYNRPVYLSEISTETVEEYLNYCVNVKGNSMRTRNDALKIIFLFYRFCVNKGYSVKNVAEIIEYGRFKKKERIYITEQETRLIFGTIEKPLIKLVLQTLYYTGMRIGELENLKLKDIDFENNIIHIKDGKGQKDRSVPLHSELKVLLTDYIDRWRLNVVSDYVICTKTGRISQEYVTAELRNTLMLAGIKRNITPHTFRHTFASNLIKNGVNVVQVQKLLGHENLQTTGIYTHSSIEDLGLAVDTLKTFM
jgi:site-specific recombinase XerD